MLAPLYPQPIMAWSRTQSWWWEKSESPTFCPLSPSLALCLCVFLCVSLFLLPISMCSSVHLSWPFRASLLQGPRLSSPEVWIKKFILCRACCLNSPSRCLRRKCTQQRWSPTPGTGLGFQLLGRCISLPGALHSKSPVPSCQPLWISQEVTKAFGGCGVSVRELCASLCQSSGCMALCVCCHIDLRNDDR